MARIVPSSSGAVARSTPRTSAPIVGARGTASIRCCAGAWATRCLLVPDVATVLSPPRRVTPPPHRDFAGTWRSLDRTNRWPGGLTGGLRPLLRDLRSPPLGHGHGGGR